MATVLVELGIVFLSLLVAVFLTAKLRLPQVVGVLAAGAIIGPFGLGLVSSGGMVDIFSELGAVLLLFVIGIEFSINKILHFGLRAILLSLVKMGIVFILVYESSLLLNLNIIESLALASIFSITSTTIFSKLVKQYELTRKDEIGMLFAVLIIEDIAAIFMLSFFSGLPGAQSLGFSDVVLSILKSLLVIVIAYLIIQRIFTRLFDYITNFKTDEMLVFSSLGLCAIFAFFASFIGLAPSIGAFLAGSMISTLKDFKKIEKTILPFGLFFSSFFFLSIGMLVNTVSIFSNLWIILVLIVVSMGAKFASISLGSYVLGQRGKAAIFAGISMLSVGEFSMLIAKQTLQLFNIDVIGIVSASVFVTALASALLINHEQQINMWFTKHITNRNKNNARKLSRYVRSFVIQVEPQGVLFKTYTGGMKDILLWGVLLILLNGGLLLFYEVLKIFGLANDSNFTITIIRAIVHFLLSITIAMKMVHVLDAVVDKTLDVLGTKDRKSLDLDKRIIYDLIFMLLLGGLSVFLPLAFSLLKLPDFFNHLAIIPAVIGLGFLWDMLKCLHEIVSIRLKGRQYEGL
ncbi:MAG: cation:proton antiporter [Candidatus Micrarchaeota archaeon]|nr:cation:proton antiporter [Candidatus Micrarchaeota archaeon]